MASIEDGEIRAPNLRGMLGATRAAPVEADRHVFGIMADREESAA